MRFFERAEVKHALAYLRLIATPDDDNAFLRVVNFPARGIGARTLEQLQDAARAAGQPVRGRARAAGQGGALRAFARWSSSCARRPRRCRCAETGRARARAQRAARRTTAPSARARTASRTSSELVNAAAGFSTEDLERESGEAADPLTAFLTHAALEAGEHQAGAGQDALQLMTMHSAKGLEFDAVFVSGLEEGLFPHEQSLLEKDGVEEERRLMYVALTRARKRLYLSFAQTRLLHGQTRYNLVSRFLDEVPAALLKWLTPRAPARPRPAHAFTAGSFARAPKRDPRFGGAPAGTGGAPSGFRVGQNVLHAKFGSGVIVDAEGHGPDARVQVNFGRQGVKWLAVAVAKLQTA